MLGAGAARGRRTRLMIGVAVVAVAVLAAPWVRNLVAAPQTGAETTQATQTRGAAGQRVTVALALAGQPAPEASAAFQSAITPLPSVVLATVDPAKPETVSVATPPAAEATDEAATTPPPASVVLASTTSDSPEYSPAIAQAGKEPLHITVATGQSLYTIFQANGLAQRDLAAILAVDKRVKKRLSRLQPGHQIAIQRDASDGIVNLIHFSSAATALEVTRQEGGKFTAVWIEKARPTASESTALAGRPDPQVSPSPAVQADRGIDLAQSGWSRQSVKVAKGDSLYTIFLAEQLSTAELAELLRSGDEAKGLKRLLPGQRLDFYVDDANVLQHVVYHADDLHSVQFRRAGSGFDASRVEVQVDRRLNNASGVIRRSLFLSAQRAGLEDRLIMELAEIFGWDVDFALDIRSGDRFSLIFEELYHGEDKVRDGAILAAEFTNRGRVIRAVRYVNPQGRAEYFTPNGLSMRKAFLRTPIDFARVSSRFGLRKHPVLHKLRQHNGVDYAANRGTPVKASGDGKVVYLGRKGGYGKTIILRHGSTYTTLYAHMSGYRKGLKRGHAVRQGQTIGFVGSSGLATGPHLHYEFQVRGAHRDPLKVDLPKAAPIAAEYKADFLDRTRGILARLERVSDTQLASNE